MRRIKKRIRHNVIPSASRMAETMRDVGYDFRTAVADLVDNSIAAGARTVAITMKFDGRNSWITIADNGKGMDAETLTEGMRYGSRRAYDENELGKFGIGLKSASTSQCRRLTVASRTSASQKRVHVREWDLDELSDDWIVHELQPAECPDHLIGPLEAHPGTVVLWEKLDRVLDYRFPDGENARKGFLVRAEELEKHLAMVMHRFLAGEARKYRGKLTITINGAPVPAWDPFARDEPHTQRMGEEQFDVATQDGSGTVTYRGYVLPPKTRFSSPKAFESLGGPERWNKQQGLYIYRNDRLIQSGGWSWLRTIDEHTKLARASIDFGSKLDGAFKVNMAKERVTLPSELRENLKPHIDRLVRRARDVYDRFEKGEGEGERRSSPGPRAAEQSSGAGSQGPVPHPPGVAERDESGTGPERSAASTFHSPGPAEIREALEMTARETGQTGALGKLIKSVAQRFPEVARALGF